MDDKVTEKVTVKPKLSSVDTKLLIEIIQDMVKDTDNRISQLEKLKQKKIEILKSI